MRYEFDVCMCIGGGERLWVWLCLFWQNARTIKRQHQSKRTCPWVEVVRNIALSLALALKSLISSHWKMLKRAQCSLWRIMTAIMSEPITQRELSHSADSDTMSRSWAGWISSTGQHQCAIVHIQLTIIHFIITWLNCTKMIVRHRNYVVHMSFRFAIEIICVMPIVLMFICEIYCTNCNYENSS